MAKVRDFKFCTLVHHVSFSTVITNCALSMRGHGHVTSLILEKYAIISQKWYKIDA